MSQPVINSRIIKLEPINWKELQFIQQEDFKEWLPNGDKKLIESLLKYQFADPFKVWHHNGINYCLDGRHRFLDLKSVSENGHEVPDMLPATFIDCKDMKEAAELVLVYSSAYAKTTQQGLLDFVKNFDLDFPDMQAIMNIPEFDDIAFQGLLRESSGIEPGEKIILVNVVGSLAIRVRRQFNGGRKVGKMHQNVLVFYKGDPKKIKENYPELNLGELEETPEVI